MCLLDDDELFSEFKEKVFFLCIPFVLSAKIVHFCSTFNIRPISKAVKLELVSFEKDTTISSLVIERIQLVLKYLKMYCNYRGFGYANVEFNIITTRSLVTKVTLSHPSNAMASKVAERNDCEFHADISSNQIYVNSNIEQLPKVMRSHDFASSILQLIKVTPENLHELKLMLDCLANLNNEEEMFQYFSSKRFITNYDRISSKSK
ncbi:hypothetical protein C9374_011801 [Naegleria lovaniensis]|uniref:Uncharacterized protein n=1 Tax=Naegleria lovaniensis TaxID=51637 RepID=A0AA88G9D3_NAELO|nr:uncharacterized protein C9374_011801 [Naegleria lovaniensis]KAG2373712.1 hypothetical protein C9374_011801 [Naegleria lovaniensis]